MSHVLLLEDNPPTARAIQAFLELLGHRVTAAPEGAQGLRLLQAGADLDLVLTDIMMPVLDGLAVIRQVRQDHPALPIIAMTGRHDSSYLATARALGAAATLLKPFSVEELQQALASLPAKAPQP